MMVQLKTFFTRYMWWSLRAAWKWRNCPTCDKWLTIRQAWWMSRPTQERAVEWTEEERRQVREQMERVLESLRLVGPHFPTSRE